MPIPNNKDLWLNTQQAEFWGVDKQKTERFLKDSLLQNLDSDLNVFNGNLVHISGLFQEVNWKFFAEFDDIQSQSFKKLKISQDGLLERLKLNIALAKKHWLDVSHREKFFVETSKRYIEFMVWIWDKYESGVVALKEKDRYKWVETSLELLPSIFDSMDDKGMLNYVAEVYKKIYENGFRSDNVKNSYKLYTSWLNRLVYNKLRTRLLHAKDEKSSNELMHNCLSFAKLITWRWFINNTKVSIDEDLKDPVLANEILVHLMADKLWLIDWMLSKWQINITDKLAMNQKPSAICKDFKEYFWRRLWKEYDSDKFLDNIWFWDLKTIKSDSYEWLTIQQKIKISVLKRVVIKLRWTWKIDMKQLWTIFTEIWQDWFNVVNQSISQNFSADMLNWKWKTSKTFGFSGIRAEVFDLYNDIQWTWLLKFSDNSINSLKKAGDVWVILWSSILAWIVIWTTLPISVTAMSGAAITWAVVGAVGTTAWILVNKNGYDSKVGMVKDIWSELAFNSWMWAFWWASSAKFIKTWVKSLWDYAKNLWVNTADLSLWAAGEWWRQKYILWNDIDFTQMFINWMLISSSWIVAAKTFGKWVSHINWFRQWVKEMTDKVPLDSNPEYNAHLQKLSSWVELSWAEKQHLIEWITKNHPYVGILRMKVWDIIRNFSFVWIKSINDALWQSFTDKIVWIIKARILENIGWLKDRKIRDNYKNLTITSSKDLWLEDFYAIATKWLDHLWEIPEIKAILSDWAYRQLVLGLENGWRIKYWNFDLPKDWLDEFIRSNPKWWKELKTLISADNTLSQKYMIIQWNLVKKLDDLDLLLWESKLKWERPEDKLVAFFQSERAWVMANVEWKRFWMFDEWKLVSYQKRVLEIDSQLVDMQNRVVALPNGTNVKLMVEVQDVFWNKSYQVNDMILGVLRKGNSIWDSDLESLLTEYVTKTNAIMDCIKDWTYSSLREDFQIASKLDWLISKVSRNQKDIRSWDVDLLKYSLFTNQKWVLTKSSFIESISSKTTWTLGFIDIKDMWLMNNKDFINLLRNMVDEWWKVKYDKMLLAWDSVTEKFVKFVENLRRNNPDVILTLWWDEVKFWVPWDLDVSWTKSLLLKSWLRWRLSHKKLDATTSSSKQVVDWLDSSCGIIKLVEEKLTVFNHTKWWLLWNLDISLELRNVDPTKIKAEERLVKQYLEKNSEMFVESLSSLTNWANGYASVPIWWNYYLRRDSKNWLIIEKIIPTTQIPKSEAYKAEKAVWNI